MMFWMPPLLADFKFFLLRFSPSHVKVWLLWLEDRPLARSWLKSWKLFEPRNAETQKPRVPFCKVIHICSKNIIIMEPQNEWLEAYYLCLFVSTGWFSGSMFSGEYVCMISVYVYVAYSNNIQQHDPFRLHADVLLHLPFFLASQPAQKQRTGQGPFVHWRSMSSKKRRSQKWRPVALERTRIRGLAKSYFCLFAVPQK